jgi:2-polyprenyl-3-methyl-5-hydroxy-6-metoxy-1,4-benzoquinol methylase
LVLSGPMFPRSARLGCAMNKYVDDANLEALLGGFVDQQFLPGRSASIEVLCQDGDMKSIFDRIKLQWTVVGAREPYASVLSDRKFSMENIESNLAEFNESGRVGLAKLRSLSVKNDVLFPQGVLFEMGCGVGRSTQHFARAFEQVHGWDVSEGNLQECKKNLSSHDALNVDLKLISQLEDYNEIPEHDVFFSEIVIQHNPPPLQYYLLRKTLSKLKPGGVFMFQTLTHHLTYDFDVPRYLEWKHGLDFEMHVLPMRWVNRAIRENGLSLLDVVKDQLGGAGVDSYTFFGIRDTVYGPSGRHG